MSRIHHLATIPELLAARAALHPGAIALEAPGGATVDYAALHARVAALSAALRARGAGRSSRVAIVLPNGLDMAVTLLGATSAAIAVPLNPAYRRAEYDAYFRELRVDYLLTRDGVNADAIAAAAETGASVLLCFAGGELAGRAATPARGADRSAASPGDVAMILLTSGSTGRAKKVPLTHRNVCTSARDVGRSLALGERDRCLAMWEQFHIGGMVDLLLAPLASGGRVICAGGFDAARFYALLDAASPTWFQAVPATLHELVAHRSARALALERVPLRFIRSVAAALPHALMEEIERTLGVPVVQTYGMTEASPLITSSALPPAARKPGSTGRACGPEVSILAADGTRARPGVRGDIAVRGDNVFAGYEDDPEANAACFRDGWFLTGDTGYLDEDGYLFLEGRSKEQINRGGEKISPHEVECALLQHPSIARAAVFGVAHARLGEDVGAAVVLHPGRALTASEVRAFAAQRLAAFKVPRRILFLDDLPRCPVGKVRRQELVALALTKDERAPYVAPRGELEGLLARLWAIELDLERVGIDDDFGALGGDSLASVRLIAAVESLLGLRVPDGAAERMQTVRSMAAVIAELEPPRAAACAGATPRDGVAFRDAELRAALYAAPAGECVRGTAPEALGAELASCDSARELHALRESILDYMTPGELRRVLAGARAARATRRMERVLGSWSVSRSSRQRARWFADTERELAQAPRALDWARRELSEHVWLFASEGTPCEQKRLVVGFCGAAQRLMMPVSRVLAHLDPGALDLLLLRDPERTHFARGIPGVCGDFASLCEVVQRFLRRHGYRDAVAFGTSAGGLAAICAALQNEWTKAVAVGADDPSRHPELEAVLRRLGCGRAARAGVELSLVHGADNARDRGAAERIVEIVPSARRSVRPRFAGHNVLHELHRRGELRSFFAACFH